VRYQTAPLPVACGRFYAWTDEAGTYATVPSRCEHMFVPPTGGDEDSFRRCGRCLELRPIKHYAWRRKARGQRDNYCSRCRAEYKREHYVANRSRYIERALTRKQVVVTQRTEYIVEFFRTRPCVDCGETDPVVLEFDHVGNKLFDISKGLRDRSWQTVLDEIAKCEVVCANCHRRRTARRGRFARAAVAQR
jgi:hypothetical protein